MKQANNIKRKKNECTQHKEIRLKQQHANVTKCRKNQSAEHKNNRLLKQQCKKETYSHLQQCQ